MKAPDKIYIDFDLINFHCLGDHLNDDEIEYIRKDALLEWAKERREAVIKEVVIQEGVRLGADAAFEELIDKLNAM